MQIQFQVTEPTILGEHVVPLGEHEVPEYKNGLLTFYLTEPNGSTTVDGGYDDYDFSTFRDAHGGYEPPGYYARQARNTPPGGGAPGH